MRLIDADELFKTPPPMSRNNGKPLTSLWAYIVDQITHAPTIEAEPVRHGRWENVADYGNGNCFGTCSVCKTEQQAGNVSALRAFHKHCRWCGAKMDLEGE